MFTVIAASRSGAQGFNLDAPSASLALLMVKMTLDRRANHPEEEDPKIGLQIAQSHQSGELNFIVTDPGRKQAFCGEFHGMFQAPVTATLADAVRHAIPYQLHKSLTTALELPSGVDMDSALRGLLLSSRK